jgi:hypothetical protein
VSPLEQPPPPVGEEIHLPGPSLLPLLLAGAIAIALVGVTVNWLLTIGGGIVATVVIAVWIRDTRREIDELPPGPH